MKRAVICILALIVCMSSSALADWNVHDLTDDELLDYRRAINEELSSRRRTELEASEEGRLIDVIPDNGLASLVRDSLGLFSVNDPVTEEQLAAVTSISATRNDHIKSLAGIQYLQGLKSLVMFGQTELSEIPHEIDVLTGLQRIDLTDCESLKVLPDELCNLINLETLVLAQSGICSLPDDIGNLENLRVLDIRITHITSLPESIYALHLDKFRREGLSLEE